MRPDQRIVTISAAAAVLATLAAFNTFSGSPKWPLSGGFHYVVDLNTTSFPASSVWDSNAQAALSDWRDMGSTSFTPGFYRINSDYTNHNNGVNSWVWQNRPAEGWLAVTFVRWSGATMADCDIYYNSRSDYSWTNGLFDPTQSRSYWPVDFRAVARHETGHAIGFEHQDATLANMNAIYQHGGGVPHAAGSGMMPHADDKHGCRTLYPGSGTTVNLMATRWREPDSASNNGARWLDTSGTWAAGTFHTASVWLSNQSNATVLGGSSGVHIGFYLSTNTTISTGDTLIGDYTFSGNWPAHASGLYTSVGGTVPSDMPAGTYYVGAVFDNTTLLTEKFDADNYALLGQVTVTNTQRSLNVQSTNPTTGVSIGVSPLDANGLGSGTTSFSRSFWNSEVVTLTAPATVSGVPFKRWRLDGLNQALGVTALNVTMTASHVATADYYHRTAGSIATFGTGCKGSNGLIPVHTASAPKGYPFLGDTTTYSLSSARPNTGCSLYVGSSNTHWGPTPLPLSLAFLGIPGCNLLVAPDVTLSLATNAAGNASLGLTVPNNPALIGGLWYTQFAILDIGSPYAIPVPHSNGVALKVGGDQ